VICHAPWTQAIFGGVIRRHDVPLAFWAHDRMTGRHWSERLARLVVPDLVICNSAYTQGTKAAVYRSVPSAVVHPPVAFVPRGRERRYVRMSLDVPEDAIVVVQASRCEAWKGHMLLFDALTRLQGVPGWRWWVVGGPQRSGEAAFLASLRARVERSGISDRVRWLGQRADVRTLLAAADLHCQPNLEPEPFGIAFVEALAAGLPLVSTDHGGVREIVDPSCGILVPPGDADALSDALRALIEDPSTRRRLSRAAPDRARQLCDPLTQVRRLARALDAMGPLEMAG
jgi:glycosyltransferase involved in cell wall biosynthesis